MAWGVVFNDFLCLWLPERFLNPPNLSEHVFPERE
jgi:hypothetical protein